MSNVVNANLKDVNMYYHYDSLFYPVDSSTPNMQIKIPREGKYVMDVTLLYFGYANGYIPGPFAGFLCLSELNINQCGSLCICCSISRAGKILFPFRDPTSPDANCQVQNIVQLEKHDQFRLTFIDNSGVTVPTSRIVATISITSISSDPH